MKLQFLGVGGAFAPISKGNSNMMLFDDPHKIMMIDFGATAPYIFRDELGKNFHDIDAIWISHLHSDHIGGLEHLAFSRYFIPKKDDKGNVVKIKLFMVPELMRELWETCLKGGLESVEGKVMNLTDYFECHPVEVNYHFIWEGKIFQPVQTIHIMSGYQFKNSYGLLIGTIRKTFVTTDTQFAPEQLRYFYSQASQIFHDCETLEGFRSHVHAHYDDLKTLERDTRKKMWLYHYGDKRPTVLEDGFLGFVNKHDFFEV